MPLSTIFQLYHGGQFYLLEVLSYLCNITSHPRPPNTNQKASKMHKSIPSSMLIKNIKFVEKPANGLVVAEYICRKKNIVKGPLQDYLHPLNFKPIRFSLQKWFEADSHN